MSAWEQAGRATGRVQSVESVTVNVSSVLLLSLLDETRKKNSNCQPDNQAGFLRAHCTNTDTDIAYYFSLARTDSSGSLATLSTSSMTMHTLSIGYIIALRRAHLQIKTETRQRSALDWHQESAIRPTRVANPVSSISLSLSLSLYLSLTH